LAIKIPKNKGDEGNMVENVNVIGQQKEETQRENNRKNS
jgi:hypothetical protein